MTDSSVDDTGEVVPSTVEEIIQGLEPMGDLSRFVIDDLTPDDEETFYSILEQA